MVAPFAAATDPFGDEICFDEDSCVGAGSCYDPLCVPQHCQPIVDCRGEVGPDAVGCAVNTTIDGRTCQAYAGIGVQDERHLALPLWGDASGTSVGAAVAVTNGSVYAQNLPNTWLSPSAQVEANALGLDLGTFSAGAYRSDIVTEGPRGGIYGEIAPSPDHTWTELAFFVRHDGGPAGTSEGIVVAIWLLDLMPDGCFVRGLGVDDDVRCPRVPQFIL